MVKKIFQQIQYYQVHLNHLRGKSRSSFLLLSLLTLIFCSQISGYICNYDLNVWYEKFVIVERLAMLFLLISIFKHFQKKSWILAELLLCFLIQDIIDRQFSNIREITTHDYITIGLLTTIALIKIYKKWKIKN